MSEGMIGKSVLIVFNNSHGCRQEEKAIIEDKITVDGGTKYVFRYSEKFIRLGYPHEIREFLS